MYSYVTWRMMQLLDADGNLDGSACQQNIWHHFAMFLYIWHWEYIYVTFSIPTEKKMNISTYEIFREMYFCVIFPFPPETVKLMVLILVKNKKQKSCVEERAITLEDVSLHFWDKGRGNPRIFYSLWSREGPNTVIQQHLQYRVGWRVACIQPLGYDDV